MSFDIEMDIDGVNVNVWGDFEPGEPDYRGGHPDNWHPGCGSSVMIEGYKVDFDDVIDIFGDEIIDNIEPDEEFCYQVGSFVVTGYLNEDSQLKVTEVDVVGINEEEIADQLEQGYADDAAEARASWRDEAY